MATIWDDVKSGIGAIAPTLASAFGGPLEGAAVGFICKVLGLDQTASAPQVTAAVAAATPAQQEALKQADDQFMVWMAELKVSRAVVAANDVASARQMAVARRDWVTPAIAMLVTLGFFALVVVIAFVPIPEKSQNTLSILLGSLTGAFMAIIGFYFGSSAGSAAKDKMLFNSTPTK